jgi:vitamin B12 transporter
MSKTITSSYLLALAGVISNPSMAVEDPPAEELEPMIVTATRTARTADETLASVTVITRKEIEKRQATSVQEALRGVPGLGIANSGGLGKDTSVFLRGTNSNHVLVLIDGVRMGSVTLGTTAFQDIPIDQIERIEVVRGPRSTLYGSEAIGGVIQIFTRKGGGKLTPTLSVSGGGGSHELYKISGGLSGGGENGWFNLNGSRLDDYGFNSCKGFPFLLSSGCVTSEPDKDGYSNNSGNVRAGYRFDNGLEVEGHFLHAGGHNNFDGNIFAGNETDFTQQALGGKLRYSPLPFWDVTLQGGRSLDESTFSKDGKPILFSADGSSNLVSDFGIFDSERITASFQNDFTLAEGHLLTMGFDYYKDLVDSNTRYVSTERDNLAGFAQYQGSLDKLDWILGVRHDDNEQFGGNTTGNVALGYSFSEALRLNANWGTAFKAPGFNDLYFPNYGNPNLAPEESWSAEAGASGKLAGVTWSLNGYYTHVDQMIAPVFDTSLCQGPFFFCAQNLNEARIWGIEAAVATRVWGWDVAANLSRLNPENTGDGPNDGNLLPRRAQTMFRFDLDRRFGQFNIGTTVYGEGRRFDNIQNTVRLGGYVLVDLRAGLELTKGLFLEGTVTNLLDKDYETAHLFNQAGTNFFVTLRYQPDKI